MGKSSRWYAASLIAAAVGSVCGELIWIGDPLRLGSYYWMDLIQILSRTAAAIPLMWAAGAYSSWLQRGRSWLGVINLLAVAGGILTALLLLTRPDRFGAAAAAAAATGALILIDALVSETARRGGFPWRSLTTALAAAAVGAFLFYPTSYGVTTPGFTMNMNRYAHIQGGTDRGSLEGVLVIERPAFPVDWIYAGLFPHLHIEKRDTSISLGEIQRQVFIQRAGANDVGTAVALKKLGLGQGVIPTGVQVLALLKDSPAEGRLEPGDVLTRLNGKEVGTTAMLAKVMGSVKPGDTVRVGLKRGSQEMSADIETKENPEQPGRAAFGIQVQDRTRADLTRKADYRSYIVYQGGPSHGAMLALTVIDQLTPGGVTYGNRVAGTGTLDGNGNVGEIGGIEQKAYTVARAGADVFFVPQGQEQDARKGSASLEIVPVRTLDDMLFWLKAHPKD